MWSDSEWGVKRVLTLAADGCVITAGTFAAMMGAAFVLYWLGVAPLGEPGGSGLDLVLSTLSWLLQVGGFIVGPLLTWRLCQRRFDKRSVPALLVGVVLGGAVALPIAWFGALVDWFVGLFTTRQYVGAIGYLIVVLLGFLALFVWRLADAVRDLASAERNRVALDIGRMLAAIAVAVFAAVVGIKMLAGEDALEAGVFVLLAGVQGAGAVAIADVIVHWVGEPASEPIAP